MSEEKATELLVERLVRRVEKANIEFLKQIGQVIKQIKELTPKQAHQLVQILKYNGNYEQIVKQIAKYTNLNIKDIENIFESYAKKDLSFYEKFYQYRNIPFEESITLKTQKKALIDVVKNEVYNYSRSNVLGYTIQDVLPNGKKGKTVFYGLRDTYNRVLDEALLNVGQGKDTFDTAMSKIMQQIGGSGLKTLNYESGRSVRLDSAVRMHLKSRLAEMHNENQKQVGQIIDSDGMEITVHEYPAPDHELAQGRQFSTARPSPNELSEWEKLQSGLPAIDYTGVEVNLDHDEKNGYRPISEMNCYHKAFTVVLGVSKPLYTEEQLQKIVDRNDEGFQFEGKKYNMYEGSQLQRMLERKIREQKDIQILAKASGNETLMQKSEKSISALTKKYQQLSDVSGLPTKLQRLQVEDYKPSKKK